MIVVMILFSLSDSFILIVAPKTGVYLLDFDLLDEKKGDIRRFQSDAITF